MVDIVAAQALVTGLTDGAAKNNLQGQLNNIDEVSVVDEHQLDLALTTTNATIITLADSFSTTAQFYGISKAGVTIDGNGETVTGQLRIVADNVTLKNVTVDLAMDTPTVWASGSFAVQVYGVTGVNLEDVTLKNANVGLYVNSATVVAKDITTDGNGFGGIGLGKSTTEVTNDPSLTLTGTNSHNDGANNPHIYTDQANSLWVTATGYTAIQENNEYVTGTNVKAGQTWFKKD